MSRIVFYCHDDAATFEIFEYYKQDIDALKALGHQVITCTKYRDIPFDYDAMFIWWWTYALWPALLSRLLNKPCIITGTFNFRVPGVSARDYFRRPFWQRLIIRLSVCLPAANLFVNQLELKDCSNYFRLKNARYYPHTISSDYLSGPSQQRSQSLLNIAWSGRQNLIRKGIPELLGAIRVLKDEGVEVHLTLAGLEGDGAHYLLRMIEQLGIGHEISYLGRIGRPDKIALLRACEIYVQPSHYEGFGVGIAEAMGCGACVVVCDVGAVREVVGDSGYYVSPGSSDEIATAIRRLQCDEDLRRAYQRLAYQRATSCFSFDKKRQRLRQYLSELGIG